LEYLNLPKLNLCPDQHYILLPQSSNPQITKTHFIDSLLTKFDGIVIAKQLSIKVQITQSNEAMKIKDFQGRERRDHLVGQSSALHLWRRQCGGERNQ